VTWDMRVLTAYVRGRESCAFPRCCKVALLASLCDSASTFDELIDLQNNVGRP
jgi:hypothetical protein